MSPLRFSAATALVLAAAAVLGSSCFGPAYVDCGIPSPSETGADGGLDPCHCDPPSSLGIVACPCLSGTPGDADVYNACMFIYRGEADAGADGG
jgi:hypothetical protein